MIAWPIAAARDAGAGRDDRRRRPGRAVARPRSTRRSRWSSRRARAEPPTPSAAAAPLTGAERHGDRARRRRAADQRRRRSRRSPSHHEAGGGGDDPDRRAGGSERLRAGRARDRRHGRARRRDEGGRRCERAELQIREVNTGIFAFDGGRAARALPRCAPTTHRGSTTCPTCCRSCASTSAP